MKNNEKKLNNHLLNLLYSLNGKITKKEFNQIKKFYKWNFNFKKIHIVGTNGKGSNAKYINDELLAQGFKVGLFTSPHIKSMYERVKVNNNEIDFESMVKFISTLKADFPNINFGWFDIFFLLAINYFSIKNVDVAIFEAGIGARKDVVNYINHDYLVVSSINIDHQNMLGNTIEKIANDKSYAIKKNVEVFISDSINKDCIDIFVQKAKSNNSKIHLVKTNKKTYETINISLSKFFLKSAFGIKKFKSHFILPYGRSQKIIINNIECYLDIAHNVEGIEQSLNYYKKHHIGFEQVVVSLSKDKEKDKIFKIIDKEFKNIFIYENKGRKPLKISEYNKKYNSIFNLEVFLKNINTRTLFIGSFYLISEIVEIV